MFKRLAAGTELLQDGSGVEIQAQQETNRTENAETAPERKWQECVFR